MMPTRMPATPSSARSRWQATWRVAGGRVVLVEIDARIAVDGQIDLSAADRSAG